MKLKIKSNSKKLGLVFYIYMFYFMYAPPIIRNSSIFNSEYFISFMLLFLLAITHYKEYKHSLNEMMHNKKFTVPLLLIFLSGIYFSFMSTLIGNNTKGLEGLRLVQNFVIFIYLLNSLVIVMIWDEKNLSYEDAMEVLFRIASFQGIICITMLLFPSLKTIAEICYRNVISSFSEGAYIYRTRIYGISRDYTYGMPIIQGFLAAVCFYFSISKNAKYGKYVPFIFAGALLNSRTGTFIFILGVVIAVFISHQLTTKSILAISVSLVITLYIFSTNMYIFKFISILYNEIHSVLYKRELTGTVKYLSDGLFYTPSGFSFIFGMGHRVYGSDAGMLEPTDVGYSNDLFMGGLIYCILLYTAYVILINKDGVNKRLTFEKKFLILVFLIANLKGQATVNPSIRTLISLLACIFYFLPSRASRVVVHSLTN